MSLAARLIAFGAFVWLAVWAPAVATTARQPFRVSSSLDGKTVLPRHIHWFGSTSLPRTKVAEVEFLIDGKVDWIEHKPPYAYSEDGGYLVTSWITPGRHRFSVRVLGKDGRTAVDTVIARVLPGPAPPDSIVGKWKRTIDGSLAPKPNSPGNPSGTVAYSGTYTITFDKRWIALKFPGTYNPANPNRAFINHLDWIPGATTFRIWGAVTMKVIRRSDPFGGWLCYPGGPKTDYRWSVSGDTLTLAAADRKDACGVRGFILAGEWSRVG